MPDKNFKSHFKKAHIKMEKQMNKLKSKQDFDKKFIKKLETLKF